MGKYNISLEICQSCLAVFIIIIGISVLRTSGQSAENTKDEGINLLADSVTTKSAVDLLTADDVKRVALEEHNRLRRRHNSPELIWNDALQMQAQNWADNGEFRHSPSRTRRQGRNYTGENIGLVARDVGDVDAVRDVIRSWYAEEKDYDYDRARARPGRVTGHFTQVVWRSSTHLGVGVAKLNYLALESWFVVAQYYPGGNRNGQFQQNVLRPNNTESNKV